MSKSGRQSTSIAPEVLYQLVQWQKRVPVSLYCHVATAIAHHIVVQHLSLQHIAFVRILVMQDARKFVEIFEYDYKP